MAHAFIELNTEAHGRICQRGLEMVLHHNRENAIAVQAAEIKDLKRKLKLQTEDTQWYKFSRNDIIDEKNRLMGRMNLAGQIMQENFNVLEMSILGEPMSKSDRTSAYNTFQQVFNIIASDGEDDGEESDSE